MERLWQYVITSDGWTYSGYTMAHSNFQAKVQVEALFPTGTLKFLEQTPKLTVITSSEESNG